MFIEAQQRSGAEVLDRILKSLHTRFAGTHNLTTSSFLNEVKIQIGENARDFFRETLYRKSEVNKSPLTNQ
jgi:hypothetical protein